MGKVYHFKDVLWLKIDTKYQVAYVRLTTEHLGLLRQSIDIDILPCQRNPLNNISEAVPVQQTQLTIHRWIDRAIAVHPFRDRHEAR